MPTRDEQPLPTNDKLVYDGCLRHYAVLHWKTATMHSAACCKRAMWWL